MDEDDASFYHQLLRIADQVTGMSRSRKAYSTFAFSFGSKRGSLRPPLADVCFEADSLAMLCFSREGVVDEWFKIDVSNCNLATSRYHLSPARPRRTSALCHPTSSYVFQLVVSFS